MTTESKQSSLNPVLQSALAVVAAILLGSIVNMALVMIGPALVPPPPGVDMADMDSFAAAVDEMGPLHFLFPFLAHALGTLTACLLVAKFSPRKKSVLAYAMGAFFLLGGITAASMIPAPTWFVAADLLLAYLPMAWLALQLVDTSERGSEATTSDTQLNEEN